MKMLRRDIVYDKVIFDKGIYCQISKYQTLDNSISVNFDFSVNNNYYWRMDFTDKNEIKEIDAEIERVYLRMLEKFKADLVKFVKQEMV